ncbi:MAG TPA: cyclopropane-fatty-acyl-phospholipid synthase family protein [Caulobacteraceae bacterium]|nr:cyclopropane-fatty-acyl-phospholipid synthase family protein [Caulobacteraceae bacterium]
MNALANAINAFERAPAPDGLTRAGIEFLVGSARKRLSHAPAGTERTFARQMAERPIAENTAEANEQHYELPEEFFGMVLGPHRKYSSCLYAAPTDNLAEAEALALQETAEHADLIDGQQVLELGCGWGSLSLWMAEHYPASRIISVSNSASQRHYIEGQAARRGLTNLTVITADMNQFEPPEGRRFDRVVSVEMFEHMANWPGLLARVRGWLKPDGRLFLHVFTHRATPYRFDANDQADWIARYFFTGGVMPSHGLIEQFSDLFELEQDWRWSGEHYRRTAEDWLANFDRNRAGVDRVLKQVYGADAALWRRRWRLFFLSVSGLFGHRGGEEWGVSHYRLKPVREA